MPRAGLTIETVLDVAEAIADADGLDAVTLARLAGRLGVRPPSLYKHIDGLDAVRRALSLRGLREAHRRLQTATVGKAREEAVRSLALAYWRFARERPGIYAASLLPARAGDRESAAAGDMLLGTVAAVIAGYALTGDDALHAARGLRAIIHGFVSLDAADGFRLRRDLDQSFDRLLTAFAHDLAERGSSDTVRS